MNSIDQPQALLALVPLYESCLDYFTETSAPEQWARINGLLGGILRTIPTGSREADSTRAISFFTNALRVYREKTHPTQWAATKTLLGGVHLRLLTRNRREHLSSAIDHYDAALRVWTHSSASYECATAQANLGTACRMLGAAAGGTNLHRALECYLLAQRTLTREAYPLEWAEVQQNLAETYQEIPKNPWCHSNALNCALTASEVFTRSTHPVRWATLQLVLAKAYARQGDNSAHARESAVACCRAALTVLTELESPLEWALAQTVLGINLSCFATEHDDSIRGEGLLCFDAALRVYRRDSHPSEWAYAHFNYGIALAKASQHAGDPEVDLGRAIARIEQALEVWSECDYPLDWAKAQTQLGTVYLALAHRGEDHRNKHLRMCVACYQAALRVIGQETSPSEWTLIQTNLRRAQADLAAGATIEVPKEIARVAEEALAVRIQTELSQSRVLFLRPFWDSDKTGAQLRALASALHDVKSLVALRNGREGTRRWWRPFGSREALLPNNVRLVASTRRRWQEDAIREILECDMVVIHLAPKDPELPQLPMLPVDRFSPAPRGIHIQPLQQSGIGEGLLRELIYCRQASILGRTVVILPVTLEARISGMREALRNTSVGRVYQTNKDGTVSTFPRMVAADRALQVLEDVHSLVYYSSFGDKQFNERLRAALLGCLARPVVPGPRRALVGIPAGPIALPPDWSLKWIRSTPLERLTCIPPLEIIELSPLEARLCRPDAIDYFKECHACGRDRRTMFFYQRGRSVEPGASVHMDCQYCGFRDYC